MAESILPTSYGDGQGWAAKWFVVSAPTSNMSSFFLCFLTVFICGCFEFLSISAFIVWHFLGYMFPAFGKLLFFWLFLPLPFPFFHLSERTHLKYSLATTEFFC